MKLGNIIIFSLLCTALTACNNSDSTDDTNNESDIPRKTKTIPQTYTFDSTLNDATDSVAYTGQTKRHILLNDLTLAIKALESSNDKDAVINNLNFFFDYNGDTSDAQNFSFSLTGETLIPGPTYGDISPGKNLRGKVAGNDAPEHIFGDGFFGWSTGLDDTPTPEELVDHFLDEIAIIATSRDARQVIVTDGTTVDIDKVYISAKGQDYSQLVQKFILGAVTYSQGTADYLKSDFGQDNVAPDAEGKPYTTAQHKWDEAFGYFGAARNYNEYTDDEISAKDGRAEFNNGYNDANGDGSIDLSAEINLGHSANCAKRDRGAIVATDFTKTAFDAFLTGRAILNSTSIDLTSEQLSDLQALARTASLTWEKCIAATVVRYINVVLGDMAKFDNGAYVDLNAFKSHAKQWSEMKGFALSLQFNPDSPFRTDATSITHLKMVLSNMGDAPVLASANQTDIDQYKSGLEDARDIIRDTYRFAQDNVNNW